MTSKNDQEKITTSSRNWIPVVMLVMLAFLFGISVGIHKNTSTPATISLSNTCSKAPLVIHDERRASIRLPAVNRNGTGVSANLDVSVVPGSGQILINLNRVLSKEETLNSIRMAALVASDIANIEIIDHDIIYDLYANATVLEGPSAGAAITLATIAVLEDKKIRDDVMITGTINHDGTIGPAGKIKEKAISAKENGAKAFYVSVGSSTEINYTEEEFCHTWGTYEYCQPEIKATIIDLSEEAGIQIIEAENIRDILDAFLE
ncbi:MAG: S16 family serine protease [archaeon]